MCGSEFKIELIFGLDVLSTTAMKTSIFACVRDVTNPIFGAICF